MSKMHQLKQTLCRELDEIAMKGDLGMSDLEIVHKLTDTIKNINKIEMLEGEGQSQYGRSMNSYGDSYRIGSYRNDGSYDGGSYNGYSGRRPYRMSGADGKMVEHMRMMLNKNIGPEEREAIEWALQEIENK